MDSIEFVLCFIVMLIATFTNTGGLGGAGIIVPVMMGLYRFDAKNAIALSNFSAPCSGVARYFLNLRQPHPLKNGKGVLCDYNIITLMLPSAIIGASIGSIVNLVLPGPVILIIFIFVTSFTVYTALVKYCALRKKEKSIKKTVPVTPHHQEPQQIKLTT